MAGEAAASSLRFFLDRGLGARIVPRALRQAGWTLETMDERYGKADSQDIRDTQWIEEASLAGDVLLCKDLAIAHNALEAQVVYMTTARVFALSTESLTGPAMAQWYIDNETKIVAEDTHRLTRGEAEQPRGASGLGDAGRRGGRCSRPERGYGARVARIGFIGVGRMGQPMCANLVCAGYEVTAGDLRAELESDVLGCGARWRGTPAEVAAEADILITMLPGPREVADVMTGTGAALAALPPGAAWIDMTSGSPPAGRALTAAARARGIGMLEAPAAGGGLPRAIAEWAADTDQATLDGHRLPRWHRTDRRTRLRYRLLSRTGRLRARRQLIRPPLV